jgi:hypothetical protein
VTNKLYRFFVPAVALVLGLLITFAELGQHPSTIQIVLGIAVVGAYSLALLLLQSRSETASLLAGMPVDERWSSINEKALAGAAQVIAVALVGTFIVVEYSGGDAMPYAFMTAVFGAAYLAFIGWFRWRS